MLASAGVFKKRTSQDNCRVYERDSQKYNPSVLMMISLTVKHSVNVPKISSVTQGAYSFHPLLCHVKIVVIALTIHALAYASFNLNLLYIQNYCKHIDLAKPKSGAFIVFFLFVFVCLFFCLFVSLFSNPSLL